MPERPKPESRAIGSSWRRLPGVTAPDIDDGTGPFRVRNGLPQGGGDLGLEQLQAAGELSLAQVPAMTADGDELRWRADPGR
jgi:hypothetical protein